jgi:ankyrin repeat protein
MDLLNASINGDLKLVKQILQEEKVNLDLQNKDEETALILASENSYTEIVKELIKANLDLQDKYGYYTASENVHTEIVKELIDAKANLDLQNIWKNCFNSSF